MNKLYDKDNSISLTKFNSCCVNFIKYTTIQDLYVINQYILCATLMIQTITTI